MKILRGHAAVIEEFLSIDATGLKGQGRQREVMTLEPEELPAIGNLHKKAAKDGFLCGRRIPCRQRSSKTTSQ